jgi:hypothetical protein
MSCDHPGPNEVYYDYVQCKDCRAIRTDSGWGLARCTWFKDLATAKFYALHGRMPDPIPALEDQ